MSLAGCGEFALIEQIRAQVAERDDILIGIGDDCCAVTLPPGEVLLTTTDLLLEKIHFRRDWTDLYRLGRKAVAVNISDIAAMGGRPATVSLGLGLPAGMERDDFDRLISGVLDACREYNVILTGGDTCRSAGGLMLSLTVQGGVQPEVMVRRRGAQSGDLIYVSGTLGDSALALQELFAGKIPVAELAERHHLPVARLRLGQELANRRLATAMIDLSDGLVADLGHILNASGVGATIQAACLPLSPAFRHALSEDSSLLNLAMSGGEDYELLWCTPRQRRSEVDALSRILDLPLTCVGEIVSGAGVTALSPQGEILSLAAGGFNHFASDGD